MEHHRRAGGRRAVRPAGTVGGDESWLRSTVSAPQPTSAPATGPAPDADEAAGGGSPAATRSRAHEPAVPRRSLDDSDLGWGDRLDDSNDDRLQRNRPPHW